MLDEEGGWMAMGRVWVEDVRGAVVVGCLDNA